MRKPTGPDTRLALGGTVIKLKHAHGGHTPGDTLWLLDVTSG
ncbi:MAG: hypothetical protein PHQ58_09585 [Rhodoferax sp.]|nr:hypothetical protein [Rhodoferax sp.]MDD2880679.1 hypothetical protein [Rhodoferax sp.]